MSTVEELLQVFKEIANTKPVQSCGGGSCGRKYSIPIAKINDVLIANGIEVPNHNLVPSQPKVVIPKYLTPKITHKNTF